MGNAIDLRLEHTLKQTVEKCLVGICGPDSIDPGSIVCLNDTSEVECINFLQTIAHSPGLSLVRVLFPSDPKRLV